MNPPFPNSYWLEPGRLLCGEYPRDFDDLEDHQGMDALLGAGVRAFVDLTEEGELKSYREILGEALARREIDPATIEYQRHPIRDVSVPGSPGAMRAILRTIRSARHRGVPLYLHCWGGRGRTGTVAGCALSEIFAHRGQEALDRLAERWRACAKAARSESPETGEQRRYVVSWPAPGSRTTADRVRSSLLGAAVGDALGVPVEFQGRAARVADPVTGMRAFGTHRQPAGTWSDDTSLILATLAGLERAGDDGADEPGAVMEEFVAWREQGRHTPHGEVFDIGIATREALDRSRRGVPARECGGTGERSNGNGSLMRILPVALARADDPDLVERASEMSALTHAHERSRFCCAFFCLVISEVIHGGDVAGAIDFAWQVMDHRWPFTPGERPRFEALRPDRLLAREEAGIGSGGHVIDTLEAALWVNLHHPDSYADAVLHAVNLGDDTDTTGCVAGALAGLVHGEADIPADWLGVLVKREELVRRAESFAVHCENRARALLGPPPSAD